MIAPIPPVGPAGRMADNTQPILALPGGLELRPEGYVNVDRGHAEITYWVLPVLTDRALHDLGPHRLTLCHAVADGASCRVAEKAGFRLEGTMRHALLHARVEEEDRNDPDDRDNRDNRDDRDDRGNERP
ncbi:GNAT family N-acetyltransferase [Streptomyces canus]|uniref:GNAT family N-acetyltransferase n=1 Tax=Streptomyces canus TaxID=58343 RepID=UPI0030E00F1D